MNKTNQFYYVVGRSIVPPVGIILNGKDITSNPFNRPDWINYGSIGNNATDEQLVAMNVYRLWTDVPIQPGQYYTQTHGSVIVEADKITRTDSWQAIPDKQMKDDIIENANNQIREYANKELTRDKALKWNTDYDNRAYEKLVADLSIAVNLETFDSSLGGHPPSDVEYAKHMTLQETEYLALDTELRNASAEPLLTDVERSEAQSRVATNTRVASGLETGVRTPDTGASREIVTLQGEEQMNAAFKEITFDWNTMPYYIPQVILSSIPEGTNMSKLFAMIYDQNNVYRSWMPFEEVNGEWKTPSDVNYISIAAAATSVWRVAIAQNGTSAEYEITGRVRLVPPDISFSKVRWCT